jgi:hypothetical protein
MQDVAGPEGLAAPSDALELDLAVLHDDDRVAPLGLVVDPRPARLHDDDAPVEAWRKTPSEEGQRFRGVARHSVSGRPNAGNRCGSSRLEA